MIQRPTLLALAALPMLGACATVPANAGSVRLGQTATVGPLRVTPVKVLEDSRCPMEARCIWTGRVRLEVRVSHAGHSGIHELATDKPLAVAGGSLELAGVMPPRSTQRRISPRDYRFTFRFSPAT